MGLVTFNGFVRTAKFFCKMLGIKPYDEPGEVSSKQALSQSIPYLFLLDLVVVIMGEMAFVVNSFKSGENFVKAITSLTYIIYGIVGSWKVITIFQKKQQLSILVNELNEIFPKESRAQSDMKIDRYLHQCTLTSLIYAALIMTLSWSHNLAPLVLWLFFGAEQEIPYMLHLPWNWHCHWSYYIVYVSEVIAAHFCSSGQILSDLLLFALATQVIMHYDNIARCFAATELNTDAPKKRAFVHKRRFQENFLHLKDLVVYHEKVLRLSNMLNDVFGIPLLINFITSSAVICFVGFQMAVGNTTFETILKLFLFMSSSLMQVYLISRYGQQLIDSSTNIAFAVFAHDWSNADLSYKKMLKLIIARAQKPAILRATSFINVSRNTMAELMKISYNLFALLKTIYSK